MLTLTSILIAVALSAPAQAFLLADRESILVQNGKAQSVIVTPDETSPTVRKAADEVASYLKQISGAEIRVVAEKQAPPGIRIDVGPTRNAQQYFPDSLIEDEERVLVRTVPGGVIICGGGDRGTLYAAYRFLESLGCRWLTPESENELIPQTRTVRLSNLNIDTRPAFTWRLFSASSPELETWGLKMGFNGLYSPETATANGGSFYWPRGVQGVHSFAQIMPSSRYFQPHPEWYSLLNGKRAAAGQLCVTAPGLVEEFAANVVKVFDADPSAQLISISPNDGYDWCECPNCRQLDQKLCGGRTTKQGLARERPFMGDRLFWFSNEVAGRVGQKYPEKKLLVLAYIDYSEPPDSIRPVASVVPFLCHYAPADYSRPVADPSSEANRQFNELLRRWVAISPDVMIYSYVTKGMWWRLPRPVLRPFAADVKYYHQLGINRYYCQSSLSDWAADGPLYYVIARLLWDPTADPHVIADEWIRGMFGPAATEMATFYQAVEQSVRATGKSYSDDPPNQVPGLYDRPSLDRAMAALKRAENIRCSQLVRGRIDKVARTFRYGYGMTEALERHKLAQISGDTVGMQAALEVGKKALQVLNVPDAAKYLNDSSSILELGVVAESFGKTETRGGRRCWNSDETGPGDNAGGWASFIASPQKTSSPLIVEMDVWGESQLERIVINSGKGIWSPIKPEKLLSRKPQWDTLVFHVPLAVMDSERKIQQLGFGGGDSQAWVAAIRPRE